MNKTEKICPNCKENYIPRVYNQLFCSKDCKRIAKTKKINERWTKRPAMKPRKGKTFISLGL